MKFGSPPYPALSLHLAQSLAWSETFTLRSLSALRYQTLGRTSSQLAGLVPLMGKASVSNISVAPRFRCRRKALTMAPLSVVACALAILPLSSSRFCPLAPLLPLSAPWLASYYFPSSGILLLHIGWRPTAYRRWLASPLPGGSARLLRSPIVRPLLSYS